ncbi:MAG: hypothetical protein A4S16_00975 [Proteobacteria bacterium SG_bin6]|nr:MAG: hypothetical protein A4S16_00975 [Proteobacteria bacterium SG_bin6]
MYSEGEIEAAVGAGVISPDAAAALRNYIAEQRAAPAVDEEQFRLLTGFNDIFVSVALALAIGAIAQIGWQAAPWLGGAGVAAASWGAAEFFTRRRRMALPSILLLLAFVGGVAAVPIGVIARIEPDWPQSTAALVGMGIALLAGGAAWLHWRRFRVPITVAAGTIAGVGAALGLAGWLMPNAERLLYPVALTGGLATFALAMWWDMSDRERRTRRADVAFWLHLAAAPLIAHPVFQLLGVFGQEIGMGQALLVLGLYLLFAFVALAVDRRALLVSSLVYVLYAMTALFRQAGAIELSAALTALVIGSALLLLSVFWHAMRARVVALLGGLERRLPPVQVVVPA